MLRIAQTDWRPAQASALTELPRPIHFRAYELARGTHVEAHTHPWCHFLYARSGVMQIRAGASRSLLPPFHGMWIPAGTAHEAWILEDVALESLFIDPQQLEAPRQGCQVVQIDEFARAFIHHANRVTPEHYDAQGREGRMLAVLLDVLEALPATAFSLPCPSEPRLAAMCDAIQRSPGDAHRQKDWADALHMSPRTFARRFQDETGLTFSQWRQRLRLQQAVVLLESGQGVTQAALELGYNSPSAFTHAFATLFGMTPSQFLQKQNDDA
ncbi:AraC family transcriptional regulator [Niveibacterium terrae]|uniref:AraC family transcriptional regulator n=1 Tax=Niveibacterium terrae TaxID=3373598 RepID=UPI003A8E79C2